MTTIVKMKDLGLKMGNQFLLKNIDWEVRKGEHWIVFGMNGCGKTTLLSIVAGFMEYTHGSLEVFGKEYSDETIYELRKKIGWVSGSFFDKCLAREIVLDIVLSGKFGTLGIDADITDEDVRHAKALLKELRLGSKINYPFDFLSKGERQNVLIARALMSNPELLVLDEPCTGLDIFSREYLLSTIKDLAVNTSVTIIFVTHHTEEILDVIPNCMLLKKGKCYAQGKTKELFSSEILSDFLMYPVEVQRENGRITVNLDVHSNIKTILSTY